MEEKEISNIMLPGEIRVTIQLIPDKVDPAKMGMHSRIEPANSDPKVVRKAIRALEDALVDVIGNVPQQLKGTPITPMFGTKH